MTRWVTGARPDQEGRFKIHNLPAGQYYAIAVDYLPQGEWGDPELLDRLKSKAKRFTLGDGATQTLDLKLVRRLLKAGYFLSRTLLEERLLLVVPDIFRPAPAAGRTGTRPRRSRRSARTRTIC